MKAAMSLLQKNANVHTGKLLHIISSFQRSLKLMDPHKETLPQRDVIETENPRSIAPLLTSERTLKKTFSISKLNVLTSTLK